VLAALARLEPGRLGVLAAGALLAVGDASGKARLAAAAASSRTERRLLAMQAAAAARDLVCAPTLRRGLSDRALEVRLAAAEGLVALGVDRAPAAAVLRASIGRRDAAMTGRALAALARLGEDGGDRAPSPLDMLASPDPAVRLAALPIVRALPVDQAVPLLRRLVRDPDRDVRRASADAIEAVAPQAGPRAIALYQPLLHDADPAVRAKAAGRLAQLLPAAAPGAAPPPPATPVVAAAIAQTTAQREVLAAVDAAGSAATAAAAQRETVQALVAELAAATARQPRNDTAVKHVGDLATSLDEAVTRLESLAARARAAATDATDAAGARPTAASLDRIAKAREVADAAAAAATAARAAVPVHEKRARRYIKAWTHDAQLLLNTARAALGGSNFAEAEQSLERAAKLLRGSGDSLDELDYLTVLLHAAMGDRARDPAQQRLHLAQARAALARLERSGQSPQLAQDAGAQVAELAEEIEGDAPGARP